MKRKIVLWCLFSLARLGASADTTLVRNIEELSHANKTARPGDHVILRNGVWRDVELALTCKGSPDHPIVFKAETPGKVIVSGRSMLKIAGSYITVDGLHFTDGYAGKEPVISFRKGGDAVANHCRVTNTVINGFNNPSRLQENQWVALYGKNNRIDHCSFLEKRNLGVLLAVMLDDDRSRENFHVIEANYFGVRIPLASNGGEIIRVGLSEHCQFNSNTRILGNAFEHCDGEAEIISIKSGSNIVRGNHFKECQGSVVLRHGDDNTVENNVFEGNSKEGTGGVRVINKGQWVVNNYFYKCMGTGFRSPFVIMNGVPNSPPIRYVEVSDAVIANNSFYDCAPMSICEGSDAERTVPPHDVSFLNNLFFHSTLERTAETHDDVSKIRFMGNLIGGRLTQQIGGGFSIHSMSMGRIGALQIPTDPSRMRIPVGDSLRNVGRQRISGVLSDLPGISNRDQLIKASALDSKSTGAEWFKHSLPTWKSVSVECRTGEEVMTAIAGSTDGSLTIQLTGDAYAFDRPVTLRANTLLTTSHDKPIRLSLKDRQAPFLFQVASGQSLVCRGLVLDLTGLDSRAFVSTDTSGLSSHVAFTMRDCTIRNLAGAFLNGARSSVADSIRISRCRFERVQGPVFRFEEETDAKGCYNVETMRVEGCVFSDCTGPILSMLRSGKDESTMGPQVHFRKNQLRNCRSDGETPLISLKGVQVSRIDGNTFTACNPDGTLIAYQDWVKAAHVFKDNRMQQSGVVRTNAYVSLR